MASQPEASQQDVIRKVKDLTSKWASSPFPPSFRSFVGGIAQLARASALQAEGQGFKSLCLQQKKFFEINSDGIEKIIWSSK